MLCADDVRNLPRTSKSSQRDIENFTQDLQPKAITARQFIDRGGFDTKEKLIDWVCENARMPAGEYWGYQLAQNYLYARAVAGEEPLASRLKAAPDEMITRWTPNQVHVVVVGGETNGYWRIMSAGYRKTVSVDEWR